MAETFVLSRLLGASLASAPPATRAALDAGAIEPVLLELLAEARSAWPAVSVPRETFIPYLGRRIPSDEAAPAEADVTAGLIAVLTELRVTDLYLACACAEGDPAAIGAFESTFLSGIGSVLPRPRQGELDAGDLTQALREKLLVKPANGLPKIAEYSGHGDLKSWLRVVAVRTALNMMRGKKRLVALDDDLVLAERANTGDAELAHFKKRYRADFADAFRGALETLSARDRNVLRQHYVDGLTMEQIGAVYHVHRITVVRWVEKARSLLAAGTRKRLSARLRVEKPELDSIMRLIRSQMDVSLRSYLR